MQASGRSHFIQLSIVYLLDSADGSRPVPQPIHQSYIYARSACDNIYYVIRARLCHSRRVLHMRSYECLVLPIQILYRMSYTPLIPMPRRAPLTHTNSFMHSQIYAPAHITMPRSTSTNNARVRVCLLNLSELTRCFNLQCMWVVKPNLHAVPSNAHGIYGPTGWCPAEASQRSEEKVIIQLDIPNDFSYIPMIIKKKLA